MKKRKMSRSQLRRLILQEMRTLSGRPTRTTNQLNEGVVLTALAYLGIGALSALGMFVAFSRPGIDPGGDYDETIDPSAMNRYRGLESTFEDIGQEVQKGSTPKQAVIKSLKKNQSAAQQISTLSQQNGGPSVSQVLGSSRSQYVPEAPDDSDIQSRKYGAQDPVDDGYTGLGLPFPFGGGDDDFFSPGDDEGDGFG
jgi:hypothetical protein